VRLLLAPRSTDSMEQPPLTLFPFDRCPGSRRRVMSSPPFKPCFCRRRAPTVSSLVHRTFVGFCVKMTPPHRNLASCQGRRLVNPSVAGFASQIPPPPLHSPVRSSTPRPTFLFLLARAPAHIAGTPLPMQEHRHTTVRFSPSPSPRCCVSPRPRQGCPVRSWCCHDA
jgi:hypothetical protein